MSGRYRCQEQENNTHTTKKRQPSSCLFLLSLHPLAQDDGDYHLVRGSAPCGVPELHEHLFYLPLHAPACVAVGEHDVREVLEFACTPVNALVQPPAPVGLVLAVLLGLLAALYHLVPLLLERQVKDFFFHGNLLLSRFTAERRSRLSTACSRSWGRGRCTTAQRSCFCSIAVP